MTGACRPFSDSSPRTVRPPPGASWTSLERNSIDPPFSTSLSIVCLMSALSLSLSDLSPPVPSSTRSERESAVSVSAGCASRSSVACHDSTSMSRSWPALAAPPVLPVLIVRLALSGPYCVGIRATLTE